MHNESRKIWLVALFTLMLAVPAGAQEQSLATQNGERIHPHAFQVGEKLDFDISFEFVKGGTARMQVSEIADIQGNRCYHFVSTAKSTLTVDHIYKVRDQIDSWRDVEGGFTRLYKKKLREGKYKSDKRVEYFPEDSTAFMYRRTDAKPETLSVTGHVQDVLSALYDVRTFDLKVGEPIYIDLHDIDKRYILKIDVLGKERVKVPAGTFDCIIVEPLLTSSGIFRKEGAIQVWLTDDANHMPVLMKSKLYFGRVWAKLTKYDLGGK